MPTRRLHLLRNGNVHTFGRAAFNMKRAKLPLVLRKLNGSSVFMLFHPAKSNSPEFEARDECSNSRLTRTSPVRSTVSAMLKPLIFKPSIFTPLIASSRAADSAGLCDPYCSRGATIVVGRNFFDLLQPDINTVLAPEMINELIMSDRTHPGRDLKVPFYHFTTEERVLIRLSKS